MERLQRVILFLAVTTLTSSCTISHPQCGAGYPSEFNSQYCKIPRIATNYYREHFWYSVFTYPETYFSRLPATRKQGTINILAIGDSWFAYPKTNWAYFDLVNPPSNVLTNLVSLKHPASNILSLSNAGEIVTNMAGLAMDDPLERAESIQTEHSIPWAAARGLRRMQTQTQHPFDYVLISGGGNDIYASRIKSIIDFQSCTTDVGRIRATKEERPCGGTSTLGAYRIDTPKLKELMDRLMLAYKTLIASIRAEPGYENVKIIAHTYDKIYPMPVGAVFVYGLVEKGHYGWFYPVLEELKITDPTEQRVITTHILATFQKRLLELQQSDKNFIVVETQGVIEGADARKNSLIPKVSAEIPIERRKDYWLNEIHPTSLGFRCISEAIHARIRQDMESTGHALVERDARVDYACIGVVAK
jgi:hypothetical protein